jgi:hypothetical protein
MIYYIRVYLLFFLTNSLNFSGIFFIFFKKIFLYKSVSPYEKEGNVRLAKFCQLQYTEKDYAEKVFSAR